MVPRPWEQEGWLGSAAAWIEAQVGSSSRSLTAPVEVFRSRDISCILRVRTSAGDLYFKESLAVPASCSEATLLPGLANLYPDRVPRVLAADAERGWVLLEDFGRPLGHAPPDVWVDVLTTFGRLQVDAAGRLGQLRSIGCRDRSPSRLAERIDDLARDAVGSAALTETAARRLRRMAPTLEELLGELLEYRVPRSLVHGDLHLANVARRGGGYLFFDWTDCCLSHPFLDVAYVFAENASHEEGCRDAYLALWRDHERPDRLHRMWLLAEPLSALYQAFAYQRTARFLDPAARRRFLRGVTYFVRQLLRSRLLRQARERAR